MMCGLLFYRYCNTYNIITNGLNIPDEIKQLEGVNKKLFNIVKEN